MGGRDRRLRPQPPESRQYDAALDEGGAAWGIIASLIETSKLNKVEPTRYLTDVLTKIAQGWPNSKLDELLPWAYVV
jgi:transposase